MHDTPCNETKKPRITLLTRMGKRNANFSSIRVIGAIRGLYSAKRVVRPDNKAHHAPESRFGLLLATFALQLMHAMETWSSAFARGRRLMTVEQAEETMIERKYREPFVPFVVEMAGGGSVEIPHAGLATNKKGVGFIGLDGDIVDVEFEHVRAIS